MKYLKTNNFYTERTFQNIHYRKMYKFKKLKTVKLRINLYHNGVPIRIIGIISGLRQS